MANQEHLDILKQGVKVWNQWRKEHADIHPDLSKADLSRIDLRAINLSNTNLYNADLFETNLSEANLSNANCEATELSRVNFKAANLSGVRFYYASLRQANLSQSNLCGANLGEVVMAKANLTQANLTGCRIYGLSAWDLQLEGTIQENLIITDESQPAITVDNIEVAQFVYLLLNNAKIRDVINTLTTKAVLILGRFTPRRKAVLDALREALRIHDTSRFCLTLTDRGTAM